MSEPNYNRLLLLPFEMRYWARARLKAGLPLLGYAVLNEGAEHRFSAEHMKSDDAPGGWSARIEAKTPTQDAFDMLGLMTTATEDEVKRAFKQLAFRYHPDRGGDATVFATVVDAKDRCLAFIHGEVNGGPRS